MGNQLSGAVPSLILPVETYLGDLHEFHFQNSLGSTRFLKVVKAQYREGACVLKLFIINDPSLPLKPYVQQIEAINSRLTEAPNCLPYERTIITDKVAVVVRQFGKDNLYDRLSTRPFLADIEKRWLAFQLLKALEYCHLVKVCHGDIKSQNILVSSWNWLWLTDFATFKPSTLPYDNPADFSYFFDTCRRRTCYIAPERFVAPQDAPNLLPGDDRIGAANQTFTHAMDIFSAGCVLAELFTDGNSSPPFDFSQLLAFREKRYFPDKTLSAISDGPIREMITSMIALEPSKRLAASQYLDKYRAIIFPEIFYTFLWPYAYAFGAQKPLLSADCKIQKLEKELDLIVEQLGKATDKNSVWMKLDSSYLIIVSFVTSQTRSIKFCENRLKALRLLRILSNYSETSVILDRILPYVLWFLLDSYNRVRAEAVHTVSHVLSLIDALPKSDLRIFSEYILPTLQLTVVDRCPLVRLAVAEEMSSLAETATRYLEYASTHNEDDPHVQLGADSGGSPKMDCNREARLIVELFQEMLVTLLCDSENAVRRGLVHHGLAKLCLFFGKQRSSDVLLSHVITFLNDKNDWRLRATFYDCCPALAAYIGWQSSTIILKPLLQQGLRDAEETVVAKTLLCLASLTRTGLIQKPTIYELLQDAALFLTHPNGAIRIAAVAFFCTAARFLNLADVHCKVMPIVGSYLRQPLIKLDKEQIVYKSLKDSLSRSVWDLVLSSPQFPDLLEFLKETRWQLGGALPADSSLQTAYPNPNDPSLSTFHQKLLVQGLTEEQENQLVAFGDALVKIRRMKWGAERQRIEPPASPSTGSNGNTAIRKAGVLDLSKLNIVTKYADLTTDRGRRVHSAHDRRFGGGSMVEMNEEWQHMFGGAGRGDDTLLVEPDAVSTVSSEQTLIVTTTAPSDLDTPHGFGHGTAFTAEPAQNVKSTHSMGADTQPPSGAMSLDRVSVTTTSSTFSSEGDIVAEGKKRVFDSTSGPNGSDQFSGNGNNGIDTSLAADMTIRLSDCRVSLTKFVDQKREEWRRTARVYSTHPSAASTSSNWPPPSWKPTGFLMAHTHEHKAAINRISCHPNGRFIVSASSDGTMKLWDCQKMEGRSMANRSRSTYNKIGGKVKCVTCLADQVICSSDNGLIQVLRFDAGWSKPLLLRQYQTEAENEGPLVDMVAYHDGSANVIIGVSHHGHVICWDQRQPDPAFRFRNPSRFGLVNSLAVDADQFHWACVGTTTGLMVLWDLRFQLSINVCQHPAEKPIHRLWSHPLEQSKLLVSVGGGRGELSEWNLETGTRQSTVWPCVNSPLLSYPIGEEESVAAFEPSYSTTAMYAYPASDHRSLVLLTGDSQGGIGYWDTSDVNNSYIISTADEEPQQSHAQAKNVGQQLMKSLSYRRQVVDGVQVYFVESTTGQGSASPQSWSSKTGSRRTTSSGSTDKTSSFELHVTTSHQDIVSDMALCRTGSTQWLMVTGSRDGVLKVWK